MIIKKLLRRGTEHTNFSEDALAYKEMNNFLYACVFDGCSKGKESYFASTLFSKVFHNVTDTLASILDNPEDSMEKNAKMLIFQMSRKIQETRELLKLHVVELMSTMVLCVLDKNSNSCFIVAIGDGYFRVDEVESFIKNTKFAAEEQGENKPDYLAYSLEFIQNYNDFERWYAQIPEKHLFEGVTNISIASDGMNTFAEFRAPKEDVMKISPVDFLVRDETFIENEIMLEKKYNILNLKYCMANKDDLSLIRIKI